MEGKFSKAMEMLKTNQTEALEMKQMVNQIKPQQMSLLTDKSVPKAEFQGRKTK